MRVLVTGATGFIGYHAVVHLLSRGHEVRALIRSREKGEKILLPLGMEGEALIEGDMTDSAAVARALDGCDAVIHAAADVSVTTGVKNFSDNLKGTETVIAAALARGAQALFLSSVTAIFDPERPATDDSPLVRSRTRYGRSKAECDAWVRERQAEGGRVAILYPPGVVGPDDPGFSESVKAYRSFLFGTLKSEGGNQLLDVRDLAVLMTRVLEEKMCGRIVAAGHFFDWDEFTALIENETGAKISRIRAPGWLLRFAARGMDVIGKLTGKRMPMTGEGIEIATRFRPMVDSPRIAELGIVWRDPAETIQDLFGWFVSSSRLSPQSVPALAIAAETDQSGSPPAKGR